MPCMKPGHQIATAALLWLFLFQLPVSLAQADLTLAHLTESFAHPPDDCRIMMRWWRSLNRKSSGNSNR
jgi:hypothetical protein